MKTLIVYYSRTNVTEQIAKQIQEKLDCDIEKITDGGKYDGKIGYIKGGMNASMGRTSPINPISKNPSDYDIVIVGTPVWASSIATPVNTYLINYRDQIKKMASFCTCISGGYDKTLEKMAIISQKTQLAQMHLTADDVKIPTEKINNFIHQIYK